ncbi:ATP-dependent RNA helicase DbpA [Bordetella avium]|uniref:ATP-dependent RNA helicase DbpA n=1 Tax=Bordetella avium TaxID=521 RepID=UPI000E0B3E1F|nr:ATP-dependent RNA helicase DbpA [Bordetella avium]AZY54175.1 ATP-dependent RNA helicase DbpA [Bordetella avium]RIQ13594.1 ATP-dependent RNA helicase DbpA [Bordetella avium]RIQ36922.1 ATP-dependent RNA helicase DbpA [Bordetella avium]RIQ40781.1 ATP-dependent RNA helicase DbpA [Bordetella avium]RIQ42523.1 ATP-dependent RNA helicase DbpA [Bordetella avium]
MTDTSFSSLPLLPALLENLQSLGFEQMTPIQEQSLPLILDGRDLIAQAKTGSGKTAAFGLGLLQSLDLTRLVPQALVLCPTRELADQVAQELRRLARLIPNVKVLTLCGGAAGRPQAESLARGAHLVVGTPGRVQDHLARGNLDLAALKTLVLDEADRMVDMGFYDDIVAIASHCPVKRQTLLFSATYPDNIRKLSARFLRNPAEVKVQTQHDASRIEQIFYEIDEADRLDAVATLLAHYRPASTLVFCNTKIRSHELIERLRADGISAQALNGDLEQRDRDEILIQFANQSCAVLVATDVAARGLDIQNLSAVINVDVSKDTEVHVHRIGRSGRGEQKGLALSLCSPEEMRWANLIEQYQGAPLKWADIKSLRSKADRPLRAPMVTLCIQGGKKDKLRPGDLLGALTGDGGLSFEQVGKINITEFNAYVALDRQIAKQAFSRISNSNIKGRRFRMRFLEEF